ncbi:MAG: phosphoribosylanthranilate isomerase [Treponema sp.]|jgi:phosphoribosylanthranilate isomerase|nr:phosphoribosylanthranilate isomerase [Treponema sp.]
MNNVIVQIYSLTTVEDARMVIALGAHHIGVSYGKIVRTPAQVSCEEAKEIFEGVQPRAVKIGLTVAEDLDEISENLRVVLPDVLHLSGNIEAVSPSQVEILKNRFPGLKIMQAIPVLQNVPAKEQKAFEYIKQYEKASDFFLIDTKAVSAADIGATGLSHDWNIDRALVESTRVPCIIAGGLNSENVAEAIETARPYGADSFTWTNYAKQPAGRRGIKDAEKVKAFIDAVKNANVPNK